MSDPHRMLMITQISLPPKETPGPAQVVLQVYFNKECLLGLAEKLRQIAEGEQTQAQIKWSDSAVITHLVITLLPIVKTGIEPDLIPSPTPGTVN